MIETMTDTLRTLMDRQRAAFARETPSYERRMAALAAFRDGLRARQAELVAAVSEDFGGRATEETLMLELFPLYDQIRHARRHLKSWMRRRSVGGSWFLLPARAFVDHQPLGVVGVMGAWNYQILLTFSPVVDALAAGNHVMIKPSEVAPRSAEVMASIIAETFPPEYVACVTGGLDLASEFAALPFDHLCFTGSTRVGRLVMEAAARNLTPVTLELGGKSPAIIHESYPLDLAVERLIMGKMYNAGQTCVAPDYVLIPAHLAIPFEAEVHQTMARLFPKLADNQNYTRIINHHHYGRLQSLVDDARQQGGRIVELNPGHEHLKPESKVFPPTLVFEPTDSMMVMQEEIFGPVLPVVTYRTLDEAIAYVNERPRPLALYYFDEDTGRIDDVLKHTISGGVTVNDCLFHLAQHHLPFGGVGPSGMGHYHGFDGFLTFTKRRGVMVQRRFTPLSLFLPPYGKRTRFLMNALLRLSSR